VRTVYIPPKASLPHHAMQGSCRVYNARNEWVLWKLCMHHTFAGCGMHSGAVALETVRPYACNPVPGAPARGQSCGCYVFK
jgi:hypothetical protein